jgi:phosphoribosylanthranilate isomerase
MGVCREGFALSGGGLGVSPRIIGSPSPLGEWDIGGEVTTVKICSIQNVSHAIAAAEAGADYVGFNFVPGVRRQLAEEKAREMIAAFRQEWDNRGPKLVGIFADQPLAEVNRILASCGLDIAQLNGDEPPDYCREVSHPVIKAVHVPAGRPVAKVVQSLDGVMSAYEGAGAMLLLDPEVAGHLGGAGQTFPWAIAEALAKKHRFLLAGGLTPENVARAVAAVHPWGVDVSSGVERDGVKDVVKIKAFVAAGKAALVEIPRRKEPLKVLFVCGGNTCRSPMAAAIASGLLDDAVHVSSAGIDVREQGAAPHAVAVMKDLFGMDLFNHVPSDISQHPVADYDLIVAMTPDIAFRVCERYSIPSDRLVEWSVSDPYQRGRAAYEQCARQLEALVEGLIAERALPRRA